METTVKKSIRLPADLAEYIENKEGNNFSSKLVAVLEDYRDGDEVRIRRVEEYNALIDERRQSLRKLSQNINEASCVCREYAKICETVADMVSRNNR